MITTSNSLFRERDAQSLGDALLRAMPDYELSRVRTELDQLRIVPTVSPHPVQPNTELSGHRHFGNAFLSTHRQVYIPTPPVRIRAHRCLRCFSQQVAQQRIALLADMSEPLPAGTGVFTGNQPNVAADLLATRKPVRRPNDENVDQTRDGSHARMRHQLQHLGPLLGFLLDRCS